jgi:N-methylhydantoinase A
VAFVGIDIGGTFTDAVLVGDDGTVAHAKAPTTPDDLTRGFMATLAELTAAPAVGPVAGIVHGTTIATNLVVERKGARVGLITTSGFGDTIHIMQGHGYAAGIPDDQVTNLQDLEKPSPLVPKDLVAEVPERIDSRGEVVVALNEEKARAAVARLLAAKVDAIAIVFLWSFVNDAHERRMREIVREADPDIFVSVSSEVAPVVGEYPRTVSTVVNAYVGPRTGVYLDQLEGCIASIDAAQTPGLSIVHCAGGIVPASIAKELPVRLIGSGPVAGAVASQQFGATLSEPNVITTDMGGTTFDVGLVVDGVPLRSDHAVLDQYEYSVPTIEITSIGSGGGSLVWLEPITQSLRVGPASAGADPGPVCYGSGGELPTVTDCDLIVGYLNPDNFLGGRIRLDVDRAREALDRHVAGPLGITPEEAALGALAIVDAHMADLLRQVTVGRGYDPRDFAVFAFGGAGPLHAPAFARELQVGRVIVPFGPLASVWSAYGAASSDAIVVQARSLTDAAPFGHEAIEAAFVELEAQVTGELASFGAAVELRRFCDLRYGMQVHTVEVPAPSPFDAAGAEAMAEDFHRTYARLFGEGTGYRAAGMELTAVRVQGRAAAGAAAAGLSTAPLEGTPAESATRDVFWPDERAFVETPIMTLAHLVEGPIIGPAVIELPTTTIPIHPGQRAELHESGSILIHV